MARYGKEYKDRVVARLLPPESAPVERVSSEVGVSATTLERWLAEALEAASGGEPQRRDGACQGSCRVSHAATWLISAVAVSVVAVTQSRSGLSVTAPTGDQSRVLPDQRLGLA